jgi:hypothetical protein
MSGFKRLAEVEVVAEPAESANVLIEENDVIKKVPMTAVGGSGNSSGSGSVYVVTLDQGATVHEYDLNIILTKLMAGEPVFLIVKRQGTWYREATMYMDCRAYDYGHGCGVVFSRAYINEEDGTEMITINEFYMNSDGTCSETYSSFE